jgi:ferredoxin-NADP reductase/predicted pyridoxine 5'-phosphate oxidase superfamily flavin-nucleotide-binding protein
MGHKYANLMFTDSVKAIQSDKRSRDNYARMEEGEDFNYLLSEFEAEFISERDSFYMASVGETGWPYVQHRGGPAGFMKVLDTKTLGFADFSGNRQYISTGNVAHNNRVSLFFMDYPNQRRLKLIGRVEVIEAGQHALFSQLKPDNYRAKIERGFIIHIEAFDWNCPQHITPRYTEEDVNAMVEQRMAEQKAQSAIVHESRTIGAGPLGLVITGIRQLTPQIKAYELRSASQEVLPQVTAGSHLEVPVILDNGSIAVRHYSICSNPVRRDIYEIAVLNKEQGLGGSLAIHQQYQLGMQLNCSVPSNYFETALEPKQPVILLAGGIGITPIKAIAQSLVESGHAFHLHYAGRSQADMAFSDRLQRAFGDNITLYPANEGKRLSVREVMQNASDDTVFYACGPAGLLQEINELAESLSIAADRIRLERFSPDRLSSDRFSSENGSNDRAITVTLAETGKIIEVGAQQSILDALIAEGVDPMYSCKTGQCKTCVVELVEGEPDHRDTVLHETEKATKFCPCVSRAKTEHLTLKL